MRKNTSNYDKSVMLRIIDSGWQEIDKGLLHEKETKFNIHVEIKNNKRNALMGYFGVLTGSGKEFSCDSTKYMPKKKYCCSCWSHSHEMGSSRERYAWKVN